MKGKESQGAPKKSTSESNTSESNKGRRRLLQALSVGGVVAGAAAVPDKWKAPVIDAVTLPAHGQTTGDGFFGEGALSFTDVEAIDKLGAEFLAALGAEDDFQDPDGLYDALVPQAHAVEPDPDYKDTLLASSSSFGFTQAFLSAADELTARFDLILGTGDNPLDLKCNNSIVIPLCFRGSVNASVFSPLFVINCSGFGSLLIEAMILQRNAEDVLVGFRVDESSTDSLMLFRGGFLPACPSCPQTTPAGFECSAPWMDD